MIDFISPLLMEMKVLTLSLFVLLLTTGFCYGQMQNSDGLVLRGVLSDGKATHKKGKVVWSGKITMEFTNRGNGPVILINPNYAFGTGLSRVEFLFPRDRNASSSQESLGWSKTIKPSEEQAHALTSTLSILDSKAPPDNVTLILAPGESASFVEEFSFEQGYRAVEKKVRDVSGAEPLLTWSDAASWYLDSDTSPHQSGLGLGDARHVRLIYRFSSAQFNADSPDFLERTGDRWKQVGSFPVDKNGDYFVRSELIPIDGGFEKIEWPPDRRSLKFIFPRYTF